jgi:hypothetical protein
MNQLKPVNILPANLPKIYSDPILPSTSRSLKKSLSFGLSHHNLVEFSLLCHACYMLHPPYSWFDLPNNIWEWVQIMKLLVWATFSILLLLHPSWSKHSFQNLFSNTLSLWSSLNVRHHVSRPYKTTGRIMVLYTLTPYVILLVLSLIYHL